MKERTIMDKIYIDSKGKNTTIEVPKYGEIRLIIKDNKVVKYDKIESNKLD